MASHSLAAAEMDTINTEVGMLASKIEKVEEEVAEVKEKVAKVESALRGGEPYLGISDRQQILAMLGALEKEKEQLRKEKEQLREEKLRLLPAASPPAASANADLLELKATVGSLNATVGSLKRRVDETVSVQSVSISALKQTAKFETFMQGLQLNMVPYELDDQAIITAGEQLVLGDPFDWTDPQGIMKQEDSRASIEEYMAHLELLVPLPKATRLVWYDCTRNKAFLTVNQSHGVPFGVSGTADAAICLQSSVDGDLPQTGLRVIVEIKVKDAVDSSAVRQAALQVFLANIHAPRLRPIGLLSDLRERWTIIWMEDGMVRYWTVRRIAAVLVLRRVVREETVQRNGEIRHSGQEREDDPLQSLWTRYKRAAQDHRALVDNEDGLAARLAELTEFEGLGNLSGIVSPEEMAQALRDDAERMVSAMPCFAAFDAETPPPQGMYA